MLRSREKWYLNFRDSRIAELDEYRALHTKIKQQMEKNVDFFILIFPCAMKFRYNFDNTMDGFYIAPAFMDKLIVHITKNFMTLPGIKV